MPKVRRNRDLPSPDRVVAWRREYLTRAGFDEQLAATLAADLRWDLHALLGLVERGCAPALAARILAPVDEPERTQ